MDEADYALYILTQLQECIHNILITSYEIKVATNKRIIVRFNTQRDAELAIAELKATRRGLSMPRPQYQIEKGLKTDLYYLQLRV